MSVLVLGIGNILMRDEGIGVRVIEALEQDYHMPADVEVVDGGTAGMGLLDLIARREHVIVIDAVRLGAEPGTIVRLTGESIPVRLRQRLTPHSLGFGDVLAMLSVLDQSPNEVVVIGIEPADLSFGLKLSPVLTARLNALVDAVVVELTRLGHAPHPCQSAQWGRGPHG